MWHQPVGRIIEGSGPEREVVVEDTNLAGRAGRWSASHWKMAAFGWIAFAVVAVVVGGAVGTREMKDWAIANGESRHAEQILDEGNFKIPARESVLVQSKTGTIDRLPELSIAVGSLVAALSREPDVAGTISPMDHPNGGLVSRDRRSVLVQFDVKGKADAAKDKIAPIMDAVDRVQAANPTVVVEEFGQASADYEVGQRFESDMRRAELTSLPLTIAILIVAFGALVAAGLPVILAFSAVLAATGLNSLASYAGPDRSADAQRDHPDDRDGGRDRLLALTSGAPGRSDMRVVLRARRCSTPLAPRGRRC